MESKNTFMAQRPLVQGCVKQLWLSCAWDFFHIIYIYTHIPKICISWVLVLQKLPVQKLSKSWWTTAIPNQPPSVPDVPPRCPHSTHPSSPNILDTKSPRSKHGGVQTLDHGGVMALDLSGRHGLGSWWGVDSRDITSWVKFYPPKTYQVLKFVQLLRGQNLQNSHQNSH